MNQSSEINELAAALANAQKTMRVAKKDSDNPFFKSKYADLATVWHACRDALHANDLAIMQYGVPCSSASKLAKEIVAKDGSITREKLEVSNIAIATRLIHKSGQWIEGTWEAPLVKLDPQAAGSATTYARRYSLAAMVGVVVADEDDDAESAMPRSVTEIDGDRYDQGPNGLVRRQEDSDKVKAAVQEARAMGKLSGLSEKEIKGLLGFSLTYGLSFNNANKAIDYLKTFMERREAGNLTDHELTVLGIERNIA